MPTNTNVTNLKINTLTEAQYDTAVQGGVIGANELSILTDAEAGQVIQVATLPTASADELDNIYQFVGTTDANYTNGYFYKCVSDGQQPATYSWFNIQVQASSGGLPSQTGNAGKFLTTDGTDASWSDKPLVNKATAATGLVVSNTASTFVGTDCVGVGSYVSVYGTGIVGIGYNTSAAQSYSVGIGSNVIANMQKGVAIGANSVVYPDQGSGNSGIAIGYNTKSGADHAIQIGNNGTNNSTVNSDANTFKVANTNGNFEIMSADGSIPSDRLIHAINKYSTMPTAASTNLGWIVQFTGTTDSTYTHGHLYECVSDGQNPATYSWTEVSMGGGSSYTAGTGIDITSGVISVTSPTLTNTATGNNAITIAGSATTSERAVNIGFLSQVNSSGTAVGTYARANGSNSVSIGNSSNATQTRCVAIGDSSQSTSSNAIAIGYNARSTNSDAIQIGQGTNSVSNTLSVGLSSSNNYELMSADGTIPTARLTKVNSTITLTAAGWSSNTQTVNVTGMTATGVVMVSPVPADQSAYTAAGIICSAQAAGTLTFTCSTTPSAAIDVNVVML